jgi:hypothetical protein
MNRRMGALISIAFALSFSQTIIWSEGFEHGGNWPSGWTYSSRWWISGPGYYSTYAAYGQVTPPGTEYCKSPLINWNCYNNPVLHFYYKFYKNNPGTTFNITIAGNCWTIDQPAIGDFHYYEIPLNGISNSTIEWRLWTALNGCSLKTPMFTLIDDAAWLDSVWITGEPTGRGEEMTQITQNQISTLTIYPNPFSTKIEIRWQSAEGKAYTNKRIVSIKIYSVTGELVKSFNSLNSIVFWDGRDEQGILLSPGVYFVHFGSEKFSIMKKIIKM